jgi:hypothetical protein
MSNDDGTPEEAAKQGVRNVQPKTFPNGEHEMSVGRPRVPIRRELTMSRAEPGILVETKNSTFQFGNRKTVAHGLFVSE